MRIISKFKDYYDCGMSWGQDSSLIYLRIPQEKEGEVYVASPELEHFWDRSKAPSQEYVIGFCGKVYGCIAQLNRVKKEKFIFGRSEKVIELVEHHCYNIEDVDRHVEKFYDDEQKEVYYSSGKRSKFRNSYNYTVMRKDYTNRRLACEDFFSFFEEKRNSYFHHFVDNKAPIFVQYEKTKYEKNRVVINEQLSKFNFAKLFDPVIAYQELSMFVGGMASPEKTIPNISDADLIEAKGFDGWSFRKMPSKN